MLDRGHWRVRTGLYSLCSNEFTEFRQVRYRVFTWFSFPLDQPTKPSAFVSTAANLGRVSPDWTDCDLVGASLILTRSSCGIIVWNRRQQVAQVVVVDVVVIDVVVVVIVDAFVDIVVVFVDVIVTVVAGGDRRCNDNGENGEYGGSWDTDNGECRDRGDRGEFGDCGECGDLGDCGGREDRGERGDCGDCGGREGSEERDMASASKKPPCWKRSCRD